MGAPFFMRPLQRIARCHASRRMRPISRLVYPKRPQIILAHASAHGVRAAALEIGKFILPHAMGAHGRPLRRVDVDHVATQRAAAMGAHNARRLLYCGLLVACELAPMA